MRAVTVVDECRVLVGRVLDRQQVRAGSGALGDDRALGDDGALAVAAWLP